MPGHDNKRDEDQFGIIRNILKSEVTWALLVVSGVMGFVSTVVLPIQELQIQIAQIQTELQKQSEIYNSIGNRVSHLELENARIQSALGIKDK